MRLSPETVQLLIERDKVITILDVAIAMGANPGHLTMGEFDRLGLPMYGGCERCKACVAAYNAAPSKTGYLMCANSCIDDLGFPTVKAYLAWQAYQDALQEAETIAESVDID